LAARILALNGTVKQEAAGNEAGFLLCFREKAFKNGAAWT
jgi:hypothetical protein